MNIKNIKIDLEKMKPKPPKQPKPSSAQNQEKSKEIKKRIVTQTEKWDDITNLTLEDQYKYLKKIQESDFDNLDQKDQNIITLIKQQIQQKIYGYRGQDIEKGIFDIEKFIVLQGVLDLMKKAENYCYYCKEHVHILYENVREPKQWTLDRIDNKLGHNTNNLLLACLTCNLRRRTMHTERYVFTKQLNIIKNN
jgi:hypothetical protein